MATKEHIEYERGLGMECMGSVCPLCSVVAYGGVAG